MFHKAFKKVNWKCGRSIWLLFFLLSWLVVEPTSASGELKDVAEKAPADNIAPSANSAHAANTAAPAAVKKVVPFAKVYLALQGCTSCAACRSVIRQMTKGAAKDGKVSLPGDAVEIRYAEATTIPLKKVVGNLAKNRLHNLKLVDVLFDASGRIEANEDGSLLFTIETTGQRYAISIPDGMNPPPEDESLRLSAIVLGWRGADAELTLRLKSFTVKDGKSDS